MFISISIAFILIFSASIFGVLLFLVVHYDLCSKCEKLELKERDLKSQIDYYELHLKELKSNVIYYNNRLQELYNQTFCDENSKKVGKK